MRGMKKKQLAINKQLRNIQAKADALTVIPSGEQYLGAIQMTISSALLDIKKAIELLAK